MVAEDLRRILVQAGEHLRVGLGHPLRGVQRPAAVRVLADGQQDFPHRRFDPGPVHLGFDVARTRPPPKGRRGRERRRRRSEVTEEA